MPKTSSMSLRIDPAVKADLENIYSRYGMSITDAINIFLYTSRNMNGLPFDLRQSIPNADTIAAMKEGDEIIKSGRKRFGNFSEMMKDLKS